MAQIKLGTIALQCALFSSLAVLSAFSNACERTPGPQKIAVFFDGTWNDVGTNTNVRRLYDEVIRAALPGVHAYYVPGVGADARKLTGGGLGYGFAKNTRVGYEKVAKCFAPGDRIYIFGFSRGAFTARTLAAVIQQVGVVNHQAFWRTKRDGSRRFDKSGFRNAIEEAYKIQKSAAKDLYLRTHGKKLRTLSDLWRHTSTVDAIRRLNGMGSPGSAAPVLFDTDVEVVGVWDTVGSLGITHSEEEHLYLVGIEHLPRVRRAYHALSIDEDRPSFLPVLLSPRERSPRGDQDVQEIWFPGAHSDVGGGYHSTNVVFGTKDLADFSLSWMADKLRNDGLFGSTFAVMSDSHRGELSKALRHLPSQPLAGNPVARVPAPGSKLHWSVCDRIRASADNVEGATRHSLYRPSAIFAQNAFRTDLQLVSIGSALECQPATR